MIKEYVYDASLSKDYGKLVIFSPEKGKENGKVLIYFHGGGLEAGSMYDQDKTYEILVNEGITVSSPNYRIYPDAKFPEFLQDSAKAVAETLKILKSEINIKEVYIGGISAGSYISMMLHFDKRFLEKEGVDESLIKGYIFDAGQPTTHYNVLRERGVDTRTIRVDEAAPVFFCDETYKVNPEQRYKFFIAENDFPGRKAQNEMLMKAMTNFGVKESAIDYEEVPGYGHAGYTDSHDEKAYKWYAGRLLSFIK
ncbi:MAG: alpha/beta hydrolase fold domain-containing protein [Lachnospiraceae bacterium]|nr:alpha/beta hydrolase fold domain-containing protein [Lachnospiraceae bacterium]